MAASIFTNVVRNKGIDTVVALQTVLVAAAAAEAPLAEAATAARTAMMAAIELAEDAGVISAAVSAYDDALAALRPKSHRREAVARALRYAQQLVEYMADADGIAHAYG